MHVEALFVRTPLFKKDSAFRNDNGNVAVYVALAVFVNERDCDVGVRDALPQGDAEYALRAVV